MFVKLVRSPNFVRWIEATKPNILKLSLAGDIMKRRITAPIQLGDRAVHLTHS